MLEKSHRFVSYFLPYTTTARAHKHGGDPSLNLTSARIVPRIISRCFVSSGLILFANQSYL
jgi:hypothetical protein